MSTTAEQERAAAGVGTHTFRPDESRTEDRGHGHGGGSIPPEPPPRPRRRPEGGAPRWLRLATLGALIVLSLLVCVLLGWKGSDER